MAGCLPLRWRRRCRPRTLLAQAVADGLALAWQTSKERMRKGTEGDRKGWRNWVVSWPRAELLLFFSSRPLSQLLHEVTEAASKAQSVEPRAAYSRPNADL